MIKADELRIGNLVAHHDGDYANDKGDIHFVSIVAEIHGRTMVVSDSTFGLRASLNYQEAIPIPLTEEWLKRMGFQKMVDNPDPDYGPVDWVKEYRVSYQSGPDYITLWDNAGGSNGNYLLNDYSSAPLHYAHQLQNLYFALTGEELTIKEIA